MNPITSTMLNKQALPYQGVLLFAIAVTFHHAQRIEFYPETYTVRLPNGDNLNCARARNIRAYATEYQDNASNINYINWEIVNIYSVYYTTAKLTIPVKNKPDTSNIKWNNSLTWQPKYWKFSVLCIRGEPAGAWIGDTIYSTSTVDKYLNLPSIEDLVNKSSTIPSNYIYASEKCFKFTLDGTLTGSGQWTLETFALNFNIRQFMLDYPHLYNI